MNKYLNYSFLIRFGLGVIFIANALTAFFAPAEFIELIKNSFVANLSPISPKAFVGVIIGFNDAIVGLLLMSGIATRRTAVWATVWLVGVMAVIGSSLDILEHFGLIFMSTALILDSNYLTEHT
ncbi:MAG: DoxX family membrane protein [Candidatus Sungbacteria bacterium]|nr:DoxX family membrane protein [Candidatus Sungbacteria bacterium]